MSKRICNYYNLNLIPYLNKRLSIKRQSFVFFYVELHVRHAYYIQLNRLDDKKQIFWYYIIKIDRDVTADGTINSNISGKR